MFVFDNSGKTYKAFDNAMKRAIEYNDVTLNRKKMLSDPFFKSKIPNPAVDTEEDKSAPSSTKKNKT